MVFAILPPSAEVLDSGPHCPGTTFLLSAFQGCISPSPPTSQSFWTCYSKNLKGFFPISVRDVLSVVTKVKQILANLVNAFLREFFQLFLKSSTTVFYPAWLISSVENGESCE